MTSEKIYSEIQYEYSCSINKHPIFAENYHEACVILNEELGEYAEEVCKGNRKKASVELKQVASVCVRFVEMLESTENKNSINIKDVFSMTSDIRANTYDVWYANLAILTSNVGKINKYIYEYYREDGPIDKVIEKLLYTIEVCKIILKNNCR